jgi:hypothetical protein
MIPPTIQPNFRAYQIKSPRYTPRQFAGRGFVCRHLSSVGNLAQGAGPISGLATPNSVKPAQGVNIVHLRAAFFMEISSSVST